jgi:hypothetical protein
MELARHSDMRLTVKTCTDVAQLPLAATVRRLPSIGDTQTLVADRPTVSPAVLGVKPLKVGKTIGKIGENHRSSPSVTNGRQNENGGERGIRTSTRLCAEILEKCSTRDCC